MEQLLPSMQMVYGLHDQRLLHIVVTSRGQVDVLAIPVLLFMENFLDKKLDCMAEIFLARTILFGGNHHGINRFWIELIEDLLPGSFVMTYEHVLKL